MAEIVPRKGRDGKECDKLSELNHLDDVGRIEGSACDVSSRHDRSLSLHASILCTIQ